MELKLHRITRTGNSTIGELSIDGIFECYILEDQDRGLKKDLPFECFDTVAEYHKAYPGNEKLEDNIMGVKIKHITAIPAGKYEVAITWSNRFKKPMPLLIGVPGYEGIRIHSGVTQDNTSGCLLTGEGRTKDRLINSVKAFKQLESKLKEALKKGKVFIDIF